MENYLGEEIVDVSTTKYKDYTVNDWVMEYIERYGQYDGAHHKQWVLDRIARITKGTKVIVKLAKWSGFEEYRITLDEPSQEYLKWVDEMRGVESEGEYEYYYDEGIAP